MEIYKDIKGYEGLYQVSNLGNIKSLYFNREKILLQGESRGYRIVILWKNPIRKCYKVHRLVALTFLSNPDNKPEINHIDEIKGNNNLNNLEWVTHKENMLHSQIGEKHHSAKLSEIDIISIKYMVQSTMFSEKDLSKIFKVSRQMINYIKTNKLWKHTE